MKTAIVKGVCNATIVKRKEELGYTLTIISRRTGIIISSVSNLLRGVTPWRVDRLYLILNVLQLEIEDVLSDQKTIDHYKRELQIESEWHSSQTNMSQEA